MKQLSLIRDTARELTHHCEMLSSLERGEWHSLDKMVIASMQDSCINNIRQTIQLLKALADIY